jgi:hypothetical protein
MNKITISLIFFALLFAYTNSESSYAQNQSLSSQLLPSSKVDTNTTSLHNQSNPLQIQTGPQQQGEATPLGGLGQQQPSPQTQNQNQTKGPLEQLGESAGKIVGGNK